MLSMLLLSLSASVWAADVNVGDQCVLATDRKILTADGATIALHHHPGRGAPVLLVHGISSNHVFWDLDAEHSLAVWLNHQGWDVWLLDLRGHGTARYDENGKVQRMGWTIDDYGRYDVPAAVAVIQKLTGYQKLAYIGHSMGGMVGTIFLANGGESQLSTMIAVGSPAAFPDTGEALLKLARLSFSLWGAILPSVNSPSAADLAATLGRAVPWHLQERLYNPQNMEPEVVDPMLRNVVSPLSKGEMKQFADMLKSGDFTSYTGDIHYLDILEKVQLPILAIAGTGDHVVAPSWVRPYAEVPAGEKKLILAGPEGGMQEPYGHLDLGLGARAPTEIFPPIEAWLEAHPPKK